MAVACKARIIMFRAPLASLSALKQQLEHLNILEPSSFSCILPHFGQRQFDKKLESENLGTNI